MPRDWHPTPEDAIEAACLMMDAGIDVLGIQTGPLTDTIDREYVDRRYQLWARAKYSFRLATEQQPTPTRKVTLPPPGD
jgi:hypothetical protein